jgi:tetratricopeptide (TPR) repeat protein
LHDAVYDFVRRELRTSQERCEDRERLGERAVQHFRKRWEHEHNVPGDPALKVRDPRWQAATRNYLNALLWVDPDAAVRFLVPRAVEGLGFERSFAGSLLEQAGEFAQAENTLPLRRVDADFIRRVLKDISPAAPVETDDDNPLAALERLIHEAQGKSSTRPSIETLDLLLRKKSLLENLQRAIIYLLRGRALAAQKEHEAALTTLLKAETCLPQAAEDLEAQLGKAFEDLGWEMGWNDIGNWQYEPIPSESAILAYQTAVQLGIESADLYRRLGKLEQECGDLQAAERSTQKSTTLDPDNAENFNALGNVYADLGRHADAEAAYRQAIDLDPEDATPWHGLGTVYRVQGRYADAEAAYRQAIDLDPDLAAPWNGLGNVYDDLGRYADAEDAYLRVLELEPEHPYAYHNLADTYVTLGNLEKAADFFQKRISLSPDDALAAQVALGCINYSQGEVSEAKEHFQAALELWETAWQRRLQSPAGLLENKALALLGLGDKDEAIATLKEGLSQMLPGDVIDFEYYDLLAQAPQPPEGLKEIRRLLEKAVQEEK